MASAEQLKMSHNIDGRVKNVEEKVQDVRGDVHDVGIKIQDVDHRVQSVGNNISSGVQGVNDRLDQVNRSSFLYHLLIVPRAKTTSQGTSSEIVFRDGFRPQIRPPTITTHAKLATPVQLNGFFKAVRLVNGNPRELSCGYTENVRYSRSLPSGDF